MTRKTYTDREGKGICKVSEGHRDRQSYGKGERKIEEVREGGWEGERQTNRQTD